ncbi:MAG: L,D-transpeptidase [Candidatus Dormiibacterota bacterium]
MRKLLTIAIGGVLVVLLLAIGVGVGNRYEFDQRAAKLQAEWQQERAAGVSKAELAPLRSQLASLQQSRRGPLPYPYLSNALFRDPLKGLEAQTTTVHGQAVAKTRSQAQAALAALQAAYGPTPFDAKPYQTKLANAKEPTDYLHLSSSWNSQLAQVTAARTALSGSAGGLTNGLPTDVVNDENQLNQQSGQLQQAQLWTDPATQAAQAAKTYLAQSYATMAQQHQTIAQQLGAANQTLGARLQLHAKATTMVNALPGMIQQYGSGGTYASQFQQAQQDLGAAKADPQLSSAVGELQSVYNALYQKKVAAQQTLSAGSGGACIQGAPAKLIVVHTATQQLVAYDNGCPTITTLVTTGRPALPTDQGTFKIFAKYPQYKMVSPWPPGSPFYYNTAWVPDAMEFVNDGTFLHGAPWEPNSEMGPGSQYGANASHGCVHIPSNVLPQLYAWADIGTTVTVES